MKRLAFTCCGLFNALVLLAACGRLSGSALTPLSVQRTSSGHDRSWMSPLASRKSKLLYISAFNGNDVTVYDYASGKQVGMLTLCHRPANVSMRKATSISRTPAAPSTSTLTGARTPSKRLRPAETLSAVRLTRRTILRLPISSGQVTPREALPSSRRVPAKAWFTAIPPIATTYGTPATTTKETS